MIERIYQKILNGRAVQEDGVQTDVGKVAGLIGVIANLLLALIKISVGFLASSIAILADGVNNVFDTLSAVITIIGMQLASKPADKDHPYGHGRIEYVSAMLISLIVILIGLSFIKSSIDRIRHPEIVKFSLVSLTLLFLSILVKFWLYRLNRTFGKRVNSQTLLATAQDAMGDVITTCVVLLPLVTSLFTTVQIDGYFGVLVSVMIIKNGLVLFRDSINPLIGESISPELYSAISEEILRAPSISGLHDFTYENRGGGRALMTAHVEMPSGMTLEEVHAVIDQIERRVREKHHVELIIHPDPIGDWTKDEITSHKIIRNILEKFPGYRSCHDFHIPEEGNEAYLDIEVDGTQVTDTQAFQTRLTKELEKHCPYRWSIRVYRTF